MHPSIKTPGFTKSFCNSLDKLIDLAGVLCWTFHLFIGDFMLNPTGEPEFPLDMLSIQELVFRYFKQSSDMTDMIVGLMARGLFCTLGRISMFQNEFQPVQLLRVMMDDICYFSFCGL